MDDNQLNEYIKNLPKSVQDVFFDDAWEERTIEIAKKYSLTDTQTDDLANIVSLFIIGVQKPDDLLETVTIDLGVSRLLAEQIIADLENRVFEYALKMMGEKTENTEKTKTKNITVENPSRVPETKPANLPGIEIGETAHDTTPAEKAFFAAKPAPVPVAKPAAEPVQKPYSVPRFGMSQVEPKVQVLNMNQNTSTPRSTMESKLTTITTNIPLDMQKKAPAQEQAVPLPPKLPPTKYDADPYREPIQ